MWWGTLLVPGLPWSSARAQVCLRPWHWPCFLPYPLMRCIMLTPKCHCHPACPYQTDAFGKCNRTLCRCVCNSSQQRADCSASNRLHRHIARVHAGYNAASLTLVSGTAGLMDAQQRQARREKDEGLADALLAQGLPAFVQAWYQHPMWQSLRSHAR